MSEEIFIKKRAAHKMRIIKRLLNLLNKHQITLDLFNLFMCGQFQVKRAKNGLFEVSGCNKDQNNKRNFKPVLIDYEGMEVVESLYNYLKHENNSFTVPFEVVRNKDNQPECKLITKTYSLF